MQSKQKHKQTRFVWLWTDKAGRTCLSPTLQEADRCIGKEYGVSADQLFPQIMAGDGDHLIPVPVEARNLTGDSVELKVPGSGWVLVEMQAVRCAS